MLSNENAALIALSSDWNNLDALSKTTSDETGLPSAFKWFLHHQPHSVVIDGTCGFLCKSIEISVARLLSNDCKQCAFIRLGNCVESPS